MKASLVAIVLASLTMLAAPAAHAAFALAYSSGSGRGGGDNSSFNIDDVRKGAAGKCGSGCSVVVSGKGGCAAVVSAGAGQPWAVSRGTTTAAAADAAWHSCRRKGGVNCSTVASICD